jgi:PTH2 family peptidyl-tRNA hydrolase
MTEEPRELKMWLAVRCDLDLSAGKLATQAGHAYQWLHDPRDAEKPWCTAGLPRYGSPKIAVRVDSERELQRVQSEAEKAGIPYYTVNDAGRTELEPGTTTVVAFGPAYRDELPPFLRRSQLLK